MSAPTTRQDHRCGDCRHRAGDHSRTRGGENSCSFGWCPCQATPAEVKREGTPIAVTVVPAYNHASARWLR